MEERRLRISTRSKFAVGYINGIECKDEYLYKVITNTLKVFEKELKFEFNDQFVSDFYDLIEHEVAEHLRTAEWEGNVMSYLSEVKKEIFIDVATFNYDKLVPSAIISSTYINNKNSLITNIRSGAYGKYKKAYAYNKYDTSCRDPYEFIVYNSKIEADIMAKILNAANPKIGRPYRSETLTVNVDPIDSDKVEIDVYWGDTDILITHAVFMMREGGLIDWDNIDKRSFNVSRNRNDLFAKLAYRVFIKRFLDLDKSVVFKMYILNIWDFDFELESNRTLKVMGSIIELGDMYIMVNSLYKHGDKNKASFTIIYENMSYDGTCNYIVNVRHDKVSVGATDINVDIRCDFIRGAIELSLEDILNKNITKEFLPRMYRFEDLFGGTDAGK